MKFSKRSDLIIIAVLLLISAVSWFLYDNVSKGKSVKAEIYYYSELAETVDLDKSVSRTFSIPENPNVVFKVDEEGNIAFIESDCPDKVCINTGSLHKAGEYAACLPNGIVLKIVPAGKRTDDDADIVVN
ncbi:NusG domain II-containing protein [Bacillota bacterium]